ncbi:SulP family inorganic anion transporter [Kaistia terrae]|uniref:SulP family inorganic anion transporter n=1 Tax=Kaistia terrae TaxID=537017 RepID=A0ABW0PQ14_9HYPH|nr:sulfate permease [Kaistia terrae]MCX5577835.1 sulfate permease [Kaistia terrae]
MRAESVIARLLHRTFPILDWGRRYNRSTLTNDLIAALIVTVMLVPQSLAYAMLAGLPPQIGLYASMLPLVAYMLFGTSRALAVGPVAVISLMTAAAISQVAAPGSPEYLAMAVALAFLSGVILVLMGVFRLGFLAGLLSRPVISGFITASGVLIAVSQFKHILGVPAGGSTLPGMVAGLVGASPLVNPYAVVIGVGVAAFLIFVRSRLKGVLLQLGLGRAAAELIVRLGPIAAIVVTTAAAVVFDLQAKGVQLVGAIPQGLPVFSLPDLSIETMTRLAGPALLLSVVGFVESISIAQTLASKRRQRISPNQELIGLGVANLASGFSSGYPVTGGFARSVVNFDAGAETPAAGLYTAIGIGLVTLFLTPYLAHLPQATLAATIIVAVLSLVDIAAIRRVYSYSRPDFVAICATILVTWIWGVEIGVVTGVAVSLILHLHRTSRPHMAIVGQMPGTEHFRNVERHAVITDEAVLGLRVDESLYFGNCGFLEDNILKLVAERPKMRHLILMCPAVNTIDSSALDSLFEINRRLADAGVRFHLSEVKGPVMDRLRHSNLLTDLSGKVFLSQMEAVRALTRSSAAPAEPGLSPTD